MLVIICGDIYSESLSCGIEVVEHLKVDDSEAVHVDALGVILRPVAELGGDVAGGPQIRRLPVVAPLEVIDSHDLYFLLDHRRQPKVADLDRVVLPDEDVSGLEVPVDDPLRVDMIDALDDLPEHLLCLVIILNIATVDRLPQRPVLAEFHLDVQPAERARRKGGSGGPDSGALRHCPRGVLGLGIRIRIRVAAGLVLVAITSGCGFCRCDTVPVFCHILVVISISRAFVIACVLIFIFVPVLALIVFFFFFFFFVVIILIIASKCFVLVA